jgi:hypothetical protein
MGTTKVKLSSKPRKHLPHHLLLFFLSLRDSSTGHVLLGRVPQPEMIFGGSWLRSRMQVRCRKKKKKSSGTPKTTEGRELEKAATTTMVRSNRHHRY